MLSLLTGMGVPIPTQQETLNLITEKPPAIVEQIKEPTLEEKIKKNAYNCNTDTHYIRADNAHCLAKPSHVATQARNTPRTPQNSAQRGSTAGNTYSAGYCTWGVKNWLSWVPNGWGNGNEWPSNARQQGYHVSTSPTVGAVASATSYNHVAVVVAVSGSNVTIKEMNYNGLYSVNQRTTPISEWVYITP